MKKDGILEKTLRFLMHNSFLFTVSVMGLVHLVLLGITYFAGIYSLARFNVVSVIIYIFCMILGKSGNIAPAYVSLILEVSVYSSYAVYYIGWNSGSYGFLFSIVPIIIYFGCYLFKGYDRWIVVLLLILDFAIFISLYLIFANAEPVVHISDEVRMIMVIFTSFAMVFSIIFYNMIYIYSSENEMINLAQKNVQLSADANIDSLTGLLNRRGFLPMVGELMKDEKTSKFCIAFCDIDNFKRINDSYGHDCGDEVLRNISKIIIKEMDGCDICRWGGEEIIILMKDYDLGVAKGKMENLRKTIETVPTVFFNKHISATVTIGLEENKELYQEPEDIIKVADERMYYGKQHGKNILIFEDITPVS